MDNPSTNPRASRDSEAVLGAQSTSAADVPQQLFLEQPEVFRQILDAIDDMILVKGEGSRIAWANKAFRDYYAMTNEQLCAILDAPFNEVENTAQYVIDDRHVFTTGETLNIATEPVTRHDGQVRLFNTIKSAIRDSAGDVRLTVGVSRDITEKVRIEADLARHREELETLVQERTATLREITGRLQIIIGSLVEGIIAVDAGDRVTLINPAAAALVGKDAEATLGRTFAEIVPLVDEQAGRPLDGAGAMRRLAERAHAAGRLIARLSGGGGPGRLVAVTMSPLVGPGGSHAGAVCILRDVTVEREAEDRQMRHQKLESLGLLAGGIAHDFNNILMGILGNISLCRSHLEGDSESARTLEQAEHACTRAQGLARQLLTFAKGGAPTKKAMYVEQTVREAAELALRGSSVQLEFHASEGVDPVEADDGQLQQAINNLVLNAKQAMPSGGRVRISIGSVDDRAGGLPPVGSRAFVRISVEDNGPGIPAEHLSRVFDPYFTTKDTGSGLGLTSVHSIVSHHGGHVTVSSTPGRGACFSIYLPAVSAEMLPPPSDAAPPRPGGVKRLLLLDDDKTVRTVLNAMLTRLGHAVVVTGTSTDAFTAFDTAMAAGTPFHAAFIDLTMPGDLSGEEVIERLRTRDPHARIVVMTGYSTSHVIEQHRELGLLGALAKPFNLDALQAVLAKL